MGQTSSNGRERHGGGTMVPSQPRGPVVDARGDGGGSEIYRLLHEAEPGEVRELSKAYRRMKRADLAPDILAAASAARIAAMLAVTVCVLAGATVVAILAYHPPLWVVAGIVAAATGTGTMTILFRTARDVASRRQGPPPDHPAGDWSHGADARSDPA